MNTRLKLSVEFCRISEGIPLSNTPIEIVCSSQISPYRLELHISKQSENFGGVGDISSVPSLDEK